MSEESGTPQTLRPIPVILLAAGGSRRMGRPKQLLHFRGRPLVRAAAETALACGSGPVIVVTGAASGEVLSTLQDLPLRTVANCDWEHGLGTSIRLGAAVAAEIDPAGVLVMPSDQPLVTAKVLRGLVALHREEGYAVAACRYQGTVGVPALFSRELLPGLLAAPAGSGCKAMFRACADRCGFVDCPAAAFDVDTPADYAALLDRERPWNLKPIGPQPASNS